MSRGIKLLLVDDHTLFREGIRSILTRLNGIVIVGEAGRGEAACAMAAELQPEVVLMDISLPDMNGIDATRRIKEILPDTHVIILSMQSKAAYIEDAFRAGASGYVNKGSTSTHLKECIQTVLDGAFYLDSSLSEDFVQEVLLSPGTGDRKKISPGLLTPREHEVTRMIAEGLSIRAIAERLFISRKTVENHRTNIYGKLNAHSAVELIRCAAKLGLIELDHWKA